MTNEQSAELARAQRDLLDLIIDGRLTTVELQKFIREKRRTCYPVLTSLQATPFSSFKLLETQFKSRDISISTQSARQALQSIHARNVGKSPGKLINFCGPTAQELTGIKGYVSFEEILAGIKRQGYKLCFASTVPRLMLALYLASNEYFVAMKPVPIPGRLRGIFLFHTGARFPALSLCPIDGEKKEFASSTRWIVVKD